ncbi:MAG: hypothetical protein ABIT76_14190 [Chthoniobacterales bacterium]
MKKRLLLLASLSLVCLHAQADTTSGQKEVTKKFTDEAHARPWTEKDYQDLCEKVLRSNKAKRMMCEMLLKDPESAQILRTHK